MLKNAIRILAWAILLVIFVVTVSPIGDRPHLASGPSLERMAAFALLGLLFCLGYRRTWPLALGVVLMASVGFEAAQLLTPDRHARMADALVKAVSGVGGVGIGLLVTHFSPWPVPGRRDEPPGPASD